MIREETSAMQITTIGLDLAKNVFQIHGVDAEGRERSRRKLRRGELLRFFEKLSPCLVGMEACAGAHHWARQISAFGHQVKLMPPAIRSRSFDGQLCSRVRSAFEQLGSGAGERIH